LEISLDLNSLNVLKKQLLKNSKKSVVYSNKWLNIW
jgi:hypothetical protein